VHVAIQTVFELSELDQVFFSITALDNAVSEDILPGVQLERLDVLESLVNFT
jgi:hypothetical protein